MIADTVQSSTISPGVPTGGANGELTNARRVLLVFAMVLAAILYLDRVCISQSQAAISVELGLSKKQMGLAMTVFGVAYGLFEIPCGWLGDRFGPRRVLTWVVSWWSFFTLATGWARGLGSLAAFRFLFGAGEAGCFPNLTRAFGNWFTGPDRTRAQSLMWVAARWSGAFTPLLVVAVLEWMTWRQSFFLFGSLGFVWVWFFYRWFRDTPAEHLAAHRSAQGESEPQRSRVRIFDFSGARNLFRVPLTIMAWCGINSALRCQPAASAGKIENARILRGAAESGVPWRSFLRSRSVWLLCVQYACQSYGFWFYLTWLPTYIQEKFALRQPDRYLAALLAAPPLFLAGISCVATGWVTPRLVGRYGSMAQVRRALGVTGCALACAMLLLSSRLQHPVWGMVAMGFSCFGNDMAMPGSWAGCMDLGGRFAGTLAGLMNTWGCLGGLLAPWTIPYLLEAAHNDWAVIIQVIAGGYAVGAFCWLGIDPVTPLERKTPGTLGAIPA